MIIDLKFNRQNNYYKVPKENEDFSKTYNEKGDSCGIFPKSGLETIIDIKI